MPSALSSVAVRTWKIRRSCTIPWSSVVSKAALTISLFAIAAIGGFAVYGVLKAALGLRLSAEEEYEGADLSIHKIGATPEREVSW